MDPLRREKLENAIAYFAKRHYEKTGRPLTKIYLYKYLAFMDFLSVRETGRPAIGLRYLAMRYGPVPVDLHREIEKTPSSTIVGGFKVIKAKDDKNVVYIAPVERHEIDLSYFSNYEIRLMDRLIEIFADVFVKAKHMSEASHQDIKAWRKALQKGEKSEMFFEDELEGVEDEELKRERLEIYELLNASYR